MGAEDEWQAVAKRVVGTYGRLDVLVTLQDASENIRVNSVHPGMVTTPMTGDVNNNAELSVPRLAKTPMGRYGPPIDIANSCLSWRVMSLVG